MNKALHRWDVEYSQARQIQENLREELCYWDQPSTFRWVGGVDVAVDAGNGNLVSVVVVLDGNNGEAIEQSSAVIKNRFPYIPGLLSFREAPAILSSWEKLFHKPEALLADGQGIAHPRRFGLACHLGVWLNLPTVGCAKSRLIGEYTEPLEGKGNWTKLLEDGEWIGAVVRTLSGFNPLFISQGHLLPLEQCIRLVLDWCRRYRLPEPTRQAHLRVTALRKDLQQIKSKTD